MRAGRLTGPALAEALGARIGVVLVDLDRLQQALTHVTAPTGKDGHYERLEFLGDRVLGLVVAEMLFRAFPEAPEGELSVRLNTLVSAEACASVADEIGLADFIIAGAEIRSLTGAKRVNLRSDIVESLIAAIYLEQGLDAARDFIHRYWEPRARHAAAARRDPKTELQEWAHRVSGSTPLYLVTGREGPDHDPVFTVKVEVAGHATAEATGHSKREAEQAAATAILLREGVWQEEVSK